MTDPRHFTPAIKRAAFARANGHCENCTAPIRPGGFTYDHRIPWELSRDSSLENCQCLCKACDLRKTASVDLPVIAKVKRVEANHIAAFAPAHRPMPCGRLSKLRKTIKGRVIERKSQFRVHRELMARRQIGGTQ